MLSLQTMAGEELKDDVNNATLFLKRSSMTYCMCVGLYDRSHHCIEHIRTVETALTHFVPSFLSDQAISTLI